MTEFMTNGFFTIALIANAVATLMVAKNQTAATKYATALMRQIYALERKVDILEHQLNELQRLSHYLEFRKEKK